ncbi:hypothetical protein Tco_0268987 [Tanacetum coccineum]
MTGIGTTKEGFLQERGHRWCIAVVSSCRKIVDDKLEEGEDDVKSSCPLCPGRHMCYNGWDKGPRSCEGELTPKPVLSSNCRMQLACMKSESLVISGQPYGGESVLGPFVLEGVAGSPPFQGELMLVRYFGLTLLHTQKEGSYVRVKLGDGSLLSFLDSECMTRSSTKELFTPFKDLKREFRSGRSYGNNGRNYGTMSKTRADYGSGIARHKIKDNDSFKLKGQFLKELRNNTFIGSDHEDANEHIEKVLEIVDLFHILNITIDQVMLRAFPMSLTRAASHWLRNKPSGSITTWENLKTKGAIPSKTAADAKVAIQEMTEYSQKWHNGTSRTRSTETSDRLEAIQAQLNNLGREIKKVNENVYAAQVGCEQCKGGGYRETALGFYQRNNANPSYQERRQSMEDTLRKFMSESEKRHEENSNLIKEIRALTDAAIRNQGASIKTLEIQIGQMSKVLQKRGFGSLSSLTGTNPRDHVKLISTIVKADSSSICSYSEASHINNSIPRKEKHPRSFTLPCFINNVCFDNALADLGASISVMPLLTYLNLGLGKLAHIRLTVELADGIVKYPKGIVENVLVGLRERMKLDLEARLMGETLVLNRSLDSFFEDYIELNDLNVPLELRRNQVYDLMPTFEEGEVIEEFRARNHARIFGYASNCDHNKKICMDCAYNLKFSCMIVLDDMDAYRDEEMGDVIFGKSF